ncbi:MAG: toprim domain-containing protein [Chloroflexia bacterium]
MLELNRLAARYFNHLLLTSTEGAAARSYLEGRRIERSSWDSWTLGYAPDSWDAALKYLRTRNYTIEELATVGLVIERTGGGGHYDRFRRRVMFPIRDKDGQVVAFGGRAIGDGAPKYMNSPESTVFVKGEHLYGMDVAQGAIRDAKQAVVVEGYVDAVVAHAAGFTNVVATLGTALTPVHVRNIAKLTRNVCLALDADAAGDTAAMRGWEVLRDAMRGRTIPIRSGGRVISSDRRTDVNVTIARLPRGEDPDTFIRKSPDGWRELIATARPVVEHFFAAVSESADLTTPDGRTQAVTELAPVVADVGNPIERAHYEARLGEMVGLQEHEIHMQVVRSRRAGRSSQVAYTPLQSVSQEDLTLALILRYPRLIHETPPGYADELENVQNREVLEAMHRVGQES